MNELAWQIWKSVNMPLTFSECSRYNQYGNNYYYLSLHMYSVIIHRFHQKKIAEVHLAWGASGEVSEAE